MSVILTDENGKPIEKPNREDYLTDVEFIRAYHNYRDRVSKIANAAFNDSLKKALQ